MRTLFLFMSLVLMPSMLFAITDGIYGLNNNLSASWDGTDASLTAPITPDYDYAYGDEAYLTYALPLSWPSFTFYGQAYTQITADTNGNIWFGFAGSANSFALPSNGIGPVIAAWNNDLSSYFNGGVFVQHKTDLPLGERVVIEWQAESYTDGGLALPNNFEAVLFPNGDIRIDYKSFATANAKDFGSGISSNDNTHYLSITSAFSSPVYNLSGNSYSFSKSTLQVNFIGSGGGIVTSTPAGIACNTDCSSPFPTGEQITLQPETDQYSLFGGWSGACTGTGNCSLTLNDDASATVTFNRDTAHEARIGDTIPVYYTTIQNAYDNAVIGDVIMTWDTVYNEGLLCDKTTEVTIQGGYDSNYQTASGMTKLASPFLIRQGTVRANNLAIMSAAP